MNLKKILRKIAEHEGEINKLKLEFKNLAKENGYLYREFTLENGSIDDFYWVKKPEHSEEVFKGHTFDDGDQIAHRFGGVNVEVYTNSELAELLDQKSSLIKKTLLIKNSIINLKNGKTVSFLGIETDGRIRASYSNGRIRYFNKDEIIE
jgi:hypothetical protein